MNMTILNAFKEKIARGAVAGPFMKTADPAFVEASGYAGFDFAILDTEHGPVTYQAMQNNIRAAEVSGLFPVIRVQDYSESSIGKALDIGALAVQVPQVCNAEQAREAIANAKFYPKGQRGVCRFVRAAHYSSTDRAEYFANANQTMVILQLEGQEAIDNLDAILAVEGIDILFIGPYDLSQSLGVPGVVDHPKVIEKMQQIVDAAEKKNIVVGTFVDTPAAAARWKNAGVKYLSYSVDVGIYTDACRTIVEQIQKA